MNTTPENVGNSGFIAPKVSSLRKLRPRVLTPAPVLLERFPEADVRLLTQVLGETLECVYDPMFRLVSSENRFMKPLPLHLNEPVAAPAETSSFDVLTPPRHRVLTADEERQLFLRFNYARYRVMRIVRRHQGKRLGIRSTRELVRWAREALETRNMIVRLNTSLVMAMARRTKTTGVELNDLVSEGNLALLRCVDKFDCSRGFKFSTYACRAIMSGFARLAAKAARYRTQFPAPFDPTLERSDFLERKRADDATDCVSGLTLILARNSAELSTVERRVINARFALDRTETGERRSRAPTLEQVGAALGVSKERVRQIQNRALKKLRLMIEDHVLAAS